MRFFRSVGTSRLPAAAGRLWFRWGVSCRGVRVLLFAVDAETNGLYGAPFAVAAVVVSAPAQSDAEVAPPPTVVARFAARCPITGPVDPWVADHVVPALTDLAQTHDALDGMLDAFWAFWMQNRDAATCVTHVGYPVEAGLFRRCVEQDPGTRLFQGPFPLHDVATLLLGAGHDPLSVDAYLAARGLSRPPGTPHDPRYDAEAVACAAVDLLDRLTAATRPATPPDRPKETPP